MRIKIGISPINLVDQGCPGLEDVRCGREHGGVVERGPEDQRGEEGYEGQSHERKGHEEVSSQMSEVAQVQSRMLDRIHHERHGGA